jgi:hypothetical protein
MKMVSTEKLYITEMTIKELLDEYKAITKLYGDEFRIYISIPKESSLKQEYEEKLKEYYEHQRIFAVEIADRLTK